MDPRDRPTTADDFDLEDDMVLQTSPEEEHKGKRMLPHSFGNRKHRLRVEAEFKRKWRKA